MVFHIVLGLIGEPDTPIKIVATEKEAREPALPFLPKPGENATSFSLLKYLGRNFKRLLKANRAYLTSGIIITIVCRYCYGTSAWKLIIGWLAGIIARILGQLYRVYVWSDRYTSNQYRSYPLLKEEATYKDPQLLQEAFDMPVAKFYRQQDIMYQPMSGYCGYATVNTILCSISCMNEGNSLKNGILEYSQPNYIAVDVMLKLLSKLQHDYGHVWGIKRIHDLSGINREEFLSLMPQINDPSYRFLVCFHRSPLFFCNGDLNFRKERQMMAHWSPLAAYLKVSNRLLLIDVNKDYGAYFVSPERLFDAVDIRDFCSGKHMGLIRIELDKN